MGCGTQLNAHGAWCVIYRFEKDFNTKMKSNANCTNKVRTMKLSMMSPDSKPDTNPDNKSPRIPKEQSIAVAVKCATGPATCSNALNFVKLQGVYFTTVKFLTHIA